MKAQFYYNQKGFIVKSLEVNIEWANGANISFEHVKEAATDFVKLHRLETRWDVTLEEELDQLYELTMRKPFTDRML